MGSTPEKREKSPVVPVMENGKRMRPRRAGALTLTMWKRWSFGAPHMQHSDSISTFVKKMSELLLKQET